MTSKISIRFFNDKEVRAVWDDANSKWWFNIVDVCAVLSESNNPAVYWRVLKNRLLKAGNQTVTNCNAFTIHNAQFFNAQRTMHNSLCILKDMGFSFLNEEKKE